MAVQILPEGVEAVLLWYLTEGVLRLFAKAVWTGPWLACALPWLLCACGLASSFSSPFSFPLIQNREKSYGCFTGTLPLNIMLVTVKDARKMTPNRNAVPAATFSEAVQAEKRAPGR